MGKIVYIANTENAMDSKVEVEFESLAEAANDISLATVTMLFEALKNFNVPIDAKQDIHYAKEILADVIRNWDVDEYANYCRNIEREKQAYSFMEEMYMSWLESYDYSEEELFDIFIPKNFEESKITYSIDLKPFSKEMKLILVDNISNKQVCFGTIPINLNVKDREDEILVLFSIGAVFFDKNCERNKIDLDECNPFRNGCFDEKFVHELTIKMEV
ncbi:MAG: hypothetical protein ACI4F4_04560 [Lachnospiraceae bacterium]